MLAILRRLFGLTVWLAINAGVVGVLFLMIQANYSALKVSFYLQGFDMMPYREDSLVGSLFDAFHLGDVTQADLYAAGLALTVGLLTFVAHYMAYRQLRLYRDRQSYLQEGNHDMAQRAINTMKFELVGLSLLAVPLAVALTWDLDLFRFRVVAGVMGCDTPECAVELPAWSLILKDHGNNFAIQLARIGGFGYLAATAGICFLLEWAFRQVGEQWARLEEAFAGVFPAEGPIAEDQRVPLNAVFQRTPTAQEPAPAPGLHSEGSHFSGGAGPEKGAPESPTEPTPVDVPTPPGTAPEVPLGFTPSEAADSDDPEVEVIGGKPGERARLSVAIANPDHYFLDADRRVWNRRHYESLHGQSELPVAEAA